MSWLQVCYEYDGSFEGFLTCVFESYSYHEEPACFQGPEELCYTLWPARRIETDREKAARVYRSLDARLGRGASRLVYRAFLTCLEGREGHIYRFLQYGYRRGRGVMGELGHPLVSVLNKAVYHLEHEAHLYTGFARFSDYRGVLLGEIEPKNRVLPLVRGQFTQRYHGEQFLLYDRTHREALVYRPGQWTIAAVDGLTLPQAEEKELKYRQLWRRFFDTVAIEARRNPRCQNTHLPKRFRRQMTEFQGEDGTAGMGQALTER